MEAMEQPQSSDSFSSTDHVNGLSPTALAELASAQQQAAAASMHQQGPTHPSGNRRQAPCRFYGTKKGCRSGDACPYLHVAPNHGVVPGPTAPAQASIAAPATKCESTATANGARRNPSLNQHPLKHKPMPKPVSNAQRDSPRNFQLAQLRRRFHPKEAQDDSGNTNFTFGMAPTDPDFPFDMTELCCSLHVPHDWPSGESRPRLRVTNPDMPKGFQINVEKGFDGLVDSAIKDRRSLTLLGLMNSLDRNLERFLTAEKAPTIKLVANASSPKEPAVPVSGPSKDELDKQKEQDVKSHQSRETTPSKRIVPVPQKVVSYSPEERAEAEKKRNSETKQLEARLNRLPLYKKLADGLSYIIPVALPKPERLPVDLRAVKTVKLSVPLLYPLEKSIIELHTVSADEARVVETGFKNWLLNSPPTTLMAQVNYLAYNMHLLVNTPVVNSAVETQPSQNQSAGNTLDITDITNTTTAVADGEQLDNVVDADRPHIKVIPRPPEWSVRVGDNDSSSDYSSDSYEEDFTDEDDEQDGGAPIPETSASSSAANTNAPARGTALNLPGLELYGIETLEAIMLSITVKCDRCKELTDIKNVKATNDPSQPSPVKVDSCRKCANTFNIAFRQEFMHLTSQRAGYLDLNGCTAFDLLPSHFQPTCSECSTPFPAPGLVAVRGTSVMASCRECHRKMNFKISEVKFMVVGLSALSHRLTAPRRKVRENLGITSGQELPRRGRCAHYGKSYRWFRFSCCAKVFPCDKCHDAASDHPNEHANRMICGFCSREQNYRPETCGICKNFLIGKASSGFWEGGKGTRDRVKMSRKDPRKYKRL